MSWTEDFADFHNRSKNVACVIIVIIDEEDLRDKLSIFNEKDDYIEEMREWRSGEGDGAKFEMKVGFFLA